jgi:sodium/proline symporter
MADKGLLVSFSLYLLLLITVGILSYRLSKTLSDFILAGRRLGAWVVAISAQASDMSAWLLMGLPGMVIKNGVSTVWIAIGCAGGTLFNWTGVARRLRRYSEITDALTLPEFLAARFHGRAEAPIRMLSLLVIVIFYSIYIGAQFNAAGKTLSSTFDRLDYNYALVISATVIVFYTMMGGFFAVAWTDFFQGLIMVVVVVALPVIGLVHLGGIGEVVSALAQKGPEMVQVSKGLSGWDLFGVLVLGGLAWGLGYPGMPHITVRYMAINDDRKLRQSALISMVWVVLALWGAMAVGAVGYAELGATLEDPETVVPVLSRTYLPGWVAGVIISAIAAAIMSTVDSQILVLGSAVVEDFYRKLLHREASEQSCVMLSRAVTVVIGLMAVAIAWNPTKGVFGYVADAWSGLAAGFGPALILSLRWKRTTGWGVVAGMFAGVVSVMAWRYSGFLSGIIWELLPAFIISFAAIIVVSLLGEPPGKEVEAEFELAAATHLPLRDEHGNPIPIMEFEMVRDIMKK